MGVAPRMVMQILGHSQLAQTLHYQHAVPELAQAAADAMADALWDSTDQPPLVRPPTRGNHGGTGDLASVIPIRRAKRA